MMPTFNAVPNEVTGRSIATVAEPGRTSGPNPPCMFGEWKRAWLRGASSDIVTSSAEEQGIRRGEFKVRGGGRRK